LFLYNRNYAKNIKLLAVLAGGNQRKTFGIQKAKGSYFPFKYVSKLDGAAILFYSVTALTIDQDSWKRLAKAHSYNKITTKVIIFEPDESLLMAKGSYESVGGGYSVCEYDLDLIWFQVQEQAETGLISALSRLACGSSVTQVTRYLPTDVVGDDKQNESEKCAHPQGS